MLTVFRPNTDKPLEVKSGLYVPISQVLRPERTNSQNSSSKNSASTECILGIFNILRDMGSVLKDITQNVARCMESEIEALRSTVVTLFDKVSTETFYSKVFKKILPLIKQELLTKGTLCFRFDALTELGAFMRTEFLYVSVLRVASRPRVKLASCKSALNPRCFTLLTFLRRWSRC